jgi:hypothetical protein
LRFGFLAASALRFACKSAQFAIAGTFVGLVGFIGPVLTVLPLISDQVVLGNAQTRLQQTREPASISRG